MANSLDKFYRILHQSSLPSILTAESQVYQVYLLLENSILMDNMGYKEYEADLNTNLYCPLCFRVIMGNEDVRELPTGQRGHTECWQDVDGGNKR